MPTTGILDGTLLVVQVGGTQIDNLTNVEFSDTMETRNATTKDSGDETDIYATRHSWEVSAEALTAYDATEGYEELRASMMGKASVSLSWGTFVTGDPEYSGSAYVTSISKSNPLDDNSSFSVTFSGTGAVTVGTTV